MSKPRPPSDPHFSFLPLRRSASSFAKESSVLGRKVHSRAECAFISLPSTEVPSSAAEKKYLNSQITIRTTTTTTTKKILFLPPCTFSNLTFAGGSSNNVSWKQKKAEQTFIDSAFSFLRGAINAFDKRLELNPLRRDDRRSLIVLSANIC